MCSFKLPVIVSQLGDNHFVAKCHVRLASNDRSAQIEKVGQQQIRQDVFKFANKKFGNRNVGQLSWQTTQTFVGHVSLAEEVLKQLWML